MQQTPSPQHLIPSPPVPPSPVECITLTTNKSNLQSGGTILHQPYTSVREESRKAFQNFLHMKRLSQDDDHGYIFLFSYYPVQPVIQNGPMCGLVALAMASELAGENFVTTDEILAEARRRAFSKQGEMFSASALQELAVHFLSCKVEHVHLQHSETSPCLDGRDLAEQLIKRNLVLVPYDADKNHGPCQKQGHKAHWALLTGFFAAVIASDVPEELLFQCRNDPEAPLLYYWPDEPDLSLCSHLAKLVLKKSGELFVLGHHGKSRYAGLWPLTDLLLSNDNLLEAGPKKSCEEYVMPSGGVKAGLRSQVLVIHIKPKR